MHASECDVQIEEAFMQEAGKQSVFHFAMRLRGNFFWYLAMLFTLLGLAESANAQVSFRAAASASAQNGTSVISYVGAGTEAQANGGNVTPTLPAHQANDLLLCLVESNDAVAHTTATAGWTRLYTYTSSVSSQHRASLFWKTATSSSETNPTIAHSGGDGIIARCAGYRGVSATNPFDVAHSDTAASTLTSTSGRTVQSGTLTTVTNNAWVLFAAHIAENPSGLTMSTTSGLTWTAATNFYASSNLGRDEAIGLFHAGPIGVQSVGPVAANLVGQDGESTGVLIALRPNSNVTDSLTVTVPAGTTQNDTMIATVAVSPGTIGVTAPDGWTLLRQTVQSAANTSALFTYYKIATATEPANYTWSFSGGAHTGAVAGIASFSGADTGVPVEFESGSATASSTSHTAPTLTTTDANSMLVTIHEYASAGTWTPPGGMAEAIDIASRSTPNSAGISMEMNYEARPSTGATGTRTASATGNADSGATQSLVLSPLEICFTDDFNRANGDPGSNWHVGNENGLATSFGNPKIVSNRLRLTDASGQVSTYATLQRIFPGAGNRIVVEFQHFAYGGTAGADGIGIILSDASQSPAAGAFGGSMGYAPKRLDQGGDTTHPGFVGGWLGVAIDEWGNFSSNTEGRSGGTAPGLTPDSVAIRGSGSGYTGYPYLRGAVLSPGVDDATSASAAPGHKYRITVDHTNGVNAWTKVERDTTGSGNSYQTVISEFDVKAESGQNAVPSNWFLSITGATGGATNIHEIDSLRICSLSQQTMSLHHIELHHAGTSCGAATVTIKACANTDCTALYTGSVTVNLNNVGTWSSDPVTFSGGSTDVTLTASSGTVTLGTSSVTPSPSNSTLCYNGATQSCSLTFASNCFDAVESGAAPRTPLYTKIAGTVFPVDVLALSNGTTINTSFTGTVSVDLVNPKATSGNCGDTAAGLTTPVSTTFVSGNAGRKTVSLNYSNAAKEVRVRVVSGGQAACSSDNFAVRPQQFNLSTSTALNPSSNTLAAGNSFNLTATAVTSTNSTASAYTDTPALSSTRIVDHNSVTAGTLTGTLPVATTGISSASLVYQDVGTITFQSDAVTDTTFTAVDQVTGTVGVVDHGSTADCVTSSTSSTLALGRYGCTIGSGALGPLGRFKPDRYSVDATLTPACTAGTGSFTYMSQPALGFALSVSPLSSTGASLPRYTASGAYATSLCNSSSCLATLSVTGVDDGGTTFDPLNNRLDPDLPAFTWTNGAYTASGTYSFVRLAAPDGPYDNFRLRISVTDRDGVQITRLNGTTISGAASVQSDRTAIRFGRLKLFNAHGSELLNLPIQTRTEYWNSTGFVVNTWDSCTTITSSNVALSNYQGGITSSNMPAGNIYTGATGVFSSGTGTLRLNKPTTTPSSKGSVNVCVNLGTDTPNTCATAASANLPWLQGNWTGTSYDDDPAVRATFGVSRGGPVIYIRELH